MRVIYGINSVSEALKAKSDLNKILVFSGKSSNRINEILKKAKAMNISVENVSQAELDKLTKNANHQGIAAYADEFDYSSVEDILDEAKKRNEKPFILILDGITDVQNLGALIRNAECAGVHGVIIPERRAANISDTVSKISAGAAEHIRIARITNITAELKNLKDKGLWIYGAATGENSKCYYDEKYDVPMAIVIGNEGKGISRLVRENCDILIEIPMKGKINSLNASSAAAVLLFEIARQKES